MDDLVQKLEDSQDWLRLRLRLVQTRDPWILRMLRRLWPEGTVPRQLEVAALEQKIKKLEQGDDADECGTDQER